MSGYEQSNKYAIRSVYGQHLGYIVEESQSFLGTILRQLLRTRRAFHASILDANGAEVLRVHRPIKWFLNSEMMIYDTKGECVGEVKQYFYPCFRM